MADIVKVGPDDLLPEEVEARTIRNFVSMLRKERPFPRKHRKVEDAQTLRVKPSWELTTGHQNYDRFEKKIQDLIARDVTRDEPVPILEPDFSDLYPHRGPLDDDDTLDDQVFQQFQKEPRTRAVEKNYSFPVETLVQKPGDTEYNYSTASITHGLALLLIGSNLIASQTSYRDKRHEKDKLDKIRRLLTDPLTFRVVEETVRDWTSLKNILRNVSHRKDTDGDCLMIVVMSRGYNDAGREFVYFGDDKVETNEMWPLLDAEASTIANIPKIFLQIVWPMEPTNQVKADSGSTFVSVNDIGCLSPEVRLIPRMAHFFIVSAIPCKDNLGDEEMANDFVDVFTEVMKLCVFNKSWDIVRIMTEVNFRMARQDPSYSPTSNFTSSLMRSFSFQPKSSGSS